MSPSRCSVAMCGPVVKCAAGHRVGFKRHLPVVCTVCLEIVGGEKPRWVAEAQELLADVPPPPELPIRLQEPDPICPDCGGSGEILTMTDYGTESIVCDCTRPK